MPDLPRLNILLDTDTDALDDWGTCSWVEQWGEDVELFKLLDAFDEWLAMGCQPQIVANPYAFAVRTQRYYTRVAEQILGEEHPYAQYLGREAVADEIESYVNKTRMLLRDWSERWGERWGMSPVRLDLDLCLRNVVATDYTRNMRLVLMEWMLITLESGSWSEEGLTPIAYELDSGSCGAVELPSPVLSAVLGRSGAANSKTVFEARTDERVPWNYLFIEPVDEYEDWLESEGLDIIYRLWQDDLGLSPQAKQEMKQLGWLILERYANHFTALIFLDATRPGVILAPAYEPWMCDGVYTPSFRNWIVPSFEHETRHLVDRRFANGAPLSHTIAEARAFGAELEAMRRVGSSLKSIQRVESEFLEPYLAAIRGDPVEFGAFHDEDSWYSLCIALTPIVESLGIVDRFVDALKADE